MVQIFRKIFFAIFHFFLHICKRALCCFKRRRRQSCESIPLTNVGIVPNIDKVCSDIMKKLKKSTELQPWSSWEEMPTVVTDYASKPGDPVQQKIEQYREQRMVITSDARDEAENIDFFQDMIPKIIKQKKVVLHQKETDDFLSKSNLTLVPDPTYHSSELGVWDDSQSWEDQTEQDCDANEILREKKRLDRERRLADQQRKKYEKDIHGVRTIVATKIS